MKKLLILFIIMFSFFDKSLANYSQLAYEFQFKSIDGGLIKLSEFKDKVVVITGAGGGLGKEHALEFAKRGAKVVVNDLGGSGDGRGASDVADAVVDQIREAGGIAIANKASVSDRAGAKSIVDDAVAEFGTVDILVNNAGILRDKSFKNLDLADWDTVMGVHLTVRPMSHTPPGQSCTTTTTAASC